MKYLTSVAFFLLTLPAFAQDLIHESYQRMGLDSTIDNSGKFVISSIIQAKDQSLTKNQLFEIAKHTIYKNFGSGDRVIQYESKDEGKLYCRAITRNYTYRNAGINKDGGYFAYEITVLTKDGRSKVSIGNITHKGGNMTHFRDGSDFGDSFPSAWNRWGDGALGRKVNAQSQDQWIKIKNSAHLDLISTIGLFQTAFNNAVAKDDEF